MEEIINKVYEYLITYGLKVLAAILIFIVGKWAAKLISNAIEKLMLKAKVEKTITHFVRNIMYFALLLFVIIAALNKLGVQTTSIIAMLGAAGLAVGLALQGSLANFAAGIILIIFKPFKAGDLVDIADAEGIVQEIHIFNTVLNTLDNRRVVIPNAKITDGNITNYTANDKRRVDLIFGISYDDNIKTAKEVLAKIVSEDSRILKEPRVTIAVAELGDSSVNLVCRPWVKPDDYWGVYFDLTEKAKIALEAAGLSIPYPQRDVHIYQEK